MGTTQGVESLGCSLRHDCGPSLIAVSIVCCEQRHMMCTALTQSFDRLFDLPVIEHQEGGIKSRIWNGVVIDIKRLLVLACRAVADEVVLLLQLRASCGERCPPRRWTV